MTLKEMRQTRIVKSRAFKCEGERKDHMLNYAQVFVFVLERGESKCCGLLMKDRLEVKSEQVITLPMVEQLKAKNISVVPGQLFCRQCKVKFLLEAYLVR